MADNQHSGMDEGSTKAERFDEGESLTKAGEFDQPSSPIHRHDRFGPETNLYNNIT